MVLPISASAWMVVNGCGNSAFTSASSDAATLSDVAPVDAAVDTYVPPAADAGACDLAAPFQTPTPLSLNVGNEIDQTARLTPDELVIYYQASIDAGSTMSLGDAGDAASLQLYTSTRNHISDPWSARNPLPSDINGVGRVSDPSVSGDNLQIYFSTSSSAGDAGPAISIYTSTRASTASSVAGAAAVVFGGVTFSNTTQPYVLSNNLTIYFRGVATGSTANAIFRATRGSISSSFVIDTSSTAALSTVNATAGVSLPVVTEDELTIYFTSGTGGARNVSVATRASTNDPFGPVSEVGELNGYSIDEGSWISEDGCRLYLSSNADGNTHLYVATKPHKS
jgi:hypothetical protein